MKYKNFALYMNIQKVVLLFTNGQKVELLEAIIHDNNNNNNNNNNNYYYY